MLPLEEEVTTGTTRATRKKQGEMDDVNLGQINRRHATNPQRAAARLCSLGLRGRDAEAFAEGNNHRLGR